MNENDLFPGQELQADEEVKARLCSSKAFVVWPADEAGKSKKPNEVSLKLHLCMLKPLVGRAEKQPKLIHISTLEPLLKDLAAEVKVSKLLYCLWFGLLLL